MDNLDQKHKILRVSSEYPAEKRTNFVHLLEEELDYDKLNNEGGEGPSSKQQAFTSANDRDAFKRKVKTIDDLPHEMLVEIFRYLNIEDLIFGVKHVSKRWAEVSQESHVWKGVFYRPAGNTPLRRVISVLKQSPKLEIFHACSQLGTDNTILEALGMNCKNIRQLSLSVDTMNCRAIGKLLTKDLNLSIEELYLKLDGIAEIDLLNIHDFDEKDLFNAVGSCVKLRSLVLSGVILDFAYNIMEGLALGCPKLRYLNTLFLSGFEKKDFDFVLSQKGSQLRSLTLDWNSLRSQDTLPIVSRCCKRLERLNVGNYTSKPPTHPDMFKDTKIVPNDFIALKQMYGLRELALPHLGYSYRNCFLDLFENGNLSTLTALNVSFVDCFNSVLLQSLCQNCSSLERLNVMGCPEIDDESFLTLDYLTKLKYLNIKSCKLVGDKGVDYIVKCKTLKYLNLKRCPKLTIKSLKMCCEELKLHEFHFDSCKIYDKDVSGYPWHLLKFLKVRKSNYPYYRDDEDNKFPYPFLDEDSD